MLELFDQFMDARRHLIGRLQTHPEAYSSPARYLNAMAQLSAPPIKIVVESGGGIELPVGYEELGWHLYAGRELAATGRMAGMIIGPPVETAGLVHISRETAFDAYTHFTLSDILFGPDIVDVPQCDWDNANEHLGGRDMRLLRINR